MRTRVQKWGDSLILRIPKPFAAELGLEEDREVELSVENGRLIAEATSSPSYTIEELLAGVRPSNLHGEIDWGPPVGREIALGTEEHPDIPANREPFAALRSLSGSVHSDFTDISTDKYTHVAAAGVETHDEATDRS